jgi:hypothetical protein
MKLGRSLHLPQVFGNQGKLIRRGLKIFNNLAGEHVGPGEIGGIFLPVVFESDVVQAVFVAFDVANS